MTPIAPTVMASTGPYTTAAKSIGRAATVISAFRVIRTGWRSAKTATPDKSASTHIGALTPLSSSTQATARAPAAKARASAHAARRRFSDASLKKLLKTCFDLPPKRAISSSGRQSLPRRRSEVVHLATRLSAVFAALGLAALGGGLKPW